MHILVVNDDGPPSTASPYVQYLVDELKKRGHLVFLVLPHTQRSWIGKAHLINHTIQCSPSQQPDQDGWMLVDSTPAACVQMGLYHLFQDREPIDLVISGPNYGQNITALYAMSSGTLGGALEAALCGRRAVALSFTKPPNPEPSILRTTTKHSVKIIEALTNKWPTDDEVDLYSINVPVAQDVAGRRVVWTSIFANRWGLRSAFVETDQSSPSEKTSNIDGTGTRTFRWAPQLSDVDQHHLNAAGPGEDAWATANGYISIAPLRANLSTPAAALNASALKI